MCAMTRKQLSELVEVILNPAMNTDPEYRSDVRDGMFEWMLEGDCIILEEGTRIHLTNEPGWPGWLVQVRVDGETREWWGIFPTLIDTNDWEHC